MSNQTLEYERIRIDAQHADQVLSNPLFQRYLETYMAEAVENWDVEQDPVERERCWYARQEARRFVDGLQNYLISAKARLSEE